MTTIAKRLKRAREAAEFKSATAAAHHFGWNENTYRSTENGTRPPGRHAAVQYALAFKINLDWLLTGRGQMRAGGRQRFRQIPYFHLTDIRAKTKSQLRRFILTAAPRGFMPVPDEDEKLLTRTAIAVVITDDSMVDAAGSAQSLYPNDKAVIDIEKDHTPGCVVLADYNNERIIRKLRIIRGNGDEQVVGLIPLNPDYPSVETTSDHILGVLIGQYRER